MKKPTKYRSEHAIQCELIRRIDLIVTHYSEYSIIQNIFAIPNGGFRNKITARAMKYEGVKPGVLDLFLAVPKGKYHGLFIEMKSEKGRLSDTQKKWRDFFMSQNYYVTTCRTSYMALDAIFYYLWDIDGTYALVDIFNKMGWELVGWITMDKSPNKLEWRKDKE